MCNMYHDKHGKVDHDNCAILQFRSTSSTSEARVVFTPTQWLNTVRHFAQSSADYTRESFCACVLLILIRKYKCIRLMKWLLLFTEGIRVKSLWFYLPFGQWERMLNKFRPVLCDVTWCTFLIGSRQYTRALIGLHPGHALVSCAICLTSTFSQISYKKGREQRIYGNFKSSLRHRFTAAFQDV